MSSNEIQLDKDVPPPSKRGAGKSYTWPFYKMEVGESFFAEGKTSEQMNNSASHWRKKNGWKFTTETREENGVKGCRVWRLE